MSPERLCQPVFMTLFLFTGAGRLNLGHQIPETGTGIGFTSFLTFHHPHQVIRLYPGLAWIMIS